MSEKVTFFSHILDDFPMCTKKYKYTKPELKKSVNLVKKKTSLNYKKGLYFPRLVLDFEITKVLLITIIIKIKLKYLLPLSPP